MYLSYINSFINTDNGILFNVNNMEFFQLEDNYINAMKKKYEKKDLQEDEIKLLREIEESCQIQNKDSQENTALDNITSIKINISNDCNLRCSYCYASQGNYGEERNVMTKEMAANLSQVIKDKLPNIETILFFGGEPLMAVDAIEELCEAFSDKGISFLMQTNGTIYSDRIHDLVKKYDIKVTVSIDGPKEIHDIHRVYPNGKGSYENIVKNVHKLNDESESVCFIQGTYTKQASEILSKAEIVKRLYSDFRIPRIIISNVITKDESIEVIDEPGLVESNRVERFFNDVFEKNFNSDTSLRLILNGILSQKRNDQFCNAGTSQIEIDYNGDIWPCQLFINHKEFKIESIYNEVENINLGILNVKNKLQTLNKANHEDCMCCIAKFWCRKCIIKSIVRQEEVSIIKNDCNSCRKLTEEAIIEITKVIENNRYDEFSQNFEKIYSMELL